MALTQVDQGLLGTYAQYTGFKNRFINSAMLIDQRNAGAAITTTDTYCLDRWYTQNSVTAGTVTTQQVADAPAGFYNSAKKTFASVTLNSTNGYANFQQTIETNNTLDFAYGTASAQTITVSFWVKSSVTGAHSFCLQNYNATRRSYLSSYTINSANTWEQKSITIVGDTSFIIGTSTLTNAGLQVRFSQGGGTQYASATANAWQSADVFFLTGCVSPATTNGATWQVTGVQLEKGSTATSFDYRPYGTELQLCQRYYWKIGSTGNPVLFAVAGSPGADSNLLTYIIVPTPMRASPTLSSSAASTFGTWPAASGGSNILGSSFYSLGANTFSPSNQVFIEMMITLASSPGTQTNRFGFRSSTAYIDASSEL